MPPVGRSGFRWVGRGAALIACGTILLVPATAPATIAEQRQRLPPPAFCQDPVEGVWKSHKYTPMFGDWYIFTLEVRRREPGSSELVGQIRAEAWNGRPNEEEPPACRPGLWHWSVMMTAVGRTGDDGLIQFGGTSWQNERDFCGIYQPTGYNLDQFSGRIDPALQEFQSVNNDGGRAVNDPTVFRRVRCFDVDDTVESPSVEARPPAFYPGRSSGGCGLF
jgi:hypothetical protein